MLAGSECAHCNGIAKGACSAPECRGDYYCSERCHERAHRMMSGGHAFIAEAPPPWTVTPCMHASSPTALHHHIMVLLRKLRRTRNCASTVHPRHSSCAGRASLMMMIQMQICSVQTSASKRATGCCLKTHRSRWHSTPHGTSK